jgi:carbonic anhydrase
MARAGSAAAAALAGSALAADDALASRSRPRPPRTPAEALRALLAGNRRYMSGKIRQLDYSQVGDRIAETQKPFAAIITCADSRISPPVIFDLGAGNVFVSRVAGNTIDTGSLGSTEYAVAELGVRLVMVLGHSNCGAVKAAIKVANGQARFPAEKFGAIGAMIEPVVAPIRRLPRRNRTLRRSIETNARAQARRLAQTDPIIRPAVRSRRLRVVAAVYDIGSGRVRVV